jgi:hypothetical protein
MMNGIQIRAPLRSHLASGLIIPACDPGRMGRPEGSIMSNGAAFPIDGDSNGQDDRWMIDARASIDAIQTKPGSYRESRGSLPLDQIRIPEGAFPWDRGGRNFAVRAQRFRPLLIIGTLCAALSLGLIGGFQFLVFAPAATAIAHKPDCSDHALDANATSCVAPKSDREAILNAPKVQKIAAPAAMTGGGGREPSHSTTQRAAASTNTVTPATQNATSPGPRAVVVQHGTGLPRLAPVSETKPGTIEGWTVREVVGETAVLNGPNGRWRAMSGDSVPGLGKVDSIVRWGSRWIVATSNGLVSTP